MTADPVSVVAQARSRPRFSSPHPGWAEAEPPQWWDERAVSLVPRLLRERGRDRRRRRGRRHHRDGARGHPGSTPRPAAAPRPSCRTTPAPPARSRELAAALPDLDFAALTGSALTQQSVAPTLLLAGPARTGHLGAATAMVPGSYDWLARRARRAPASWSGTGRIESGLYALRDGALHRPGAGLADRRGSIRAVLPPVAGPGHGHRRGFARRGRRDRAAAGTPIVVGGADHVLPPTRPACQPGRLAGQARRRRRHPRRQRRPAGRRAAVPGRSPAAGLWLPNGCMATSGSLIRWFPSVSGGAPVAELEAEATARRAGRAHLPAVLSRREVAAARPGPARRVPRPAPRPHPGRPVPGDPRGHRLRLPPSRGDFRRTRRPAAPTARVTNGGVEVPGMEADPRRRARRRARAGPRSPGRRPRRGAGRRGRRRGAARSWACRRRPGPTGGPIEPDRARTVRAGLPGYPMPSAYPIYRLAAGAAHCDHDLAHS